MIAEIGKGKMTNEEIESLIEDIFGRGSSQETEKAMAKEKIIQRIEEIAKREPQFDEWEKMRQDTKRKQREDRRLNIFWRRNKTFPMQFGGDEQTPDVEETLEFLRRINKEVQE